jgi:hypothetical protein
MRGLHRRRRSPARALSLLAADLLGEAACYDSRWSKAKRAQQHAAAHLKPADIDPANGNDAPDGGMRGSGFVCVLSNGISRSAAQWLTPEPVGSGAAADSLCSALTSRLSCPSRSMRPRGRDLRHCPDSPDARKPYSAVTTRGQVPRSRRGESWIINRTCPSSGRCG